MNHLSVRFSRLVDYENGNVMKASESYRSGHWLNRTWSELVDTRWLQVPT
jgi:hypothetical protein